MENLRRGWFGYSRRSVEQAVAALKQEASQLRQVMEKKEEQITALQDELSQMKVTENLIPEAIIDAKQMAQRLLTEAHLKAAGMVEEAERTMKEQYERLRVEAEEIEASRLTLEGHKLALKTDLEALIASYREKILVVETQSQEDMEQAPSVSTDEKKQIVLPNLSSHPNGSPLKVVETLPSQAYGDSHSSARKEASGEVPVYQSW